MSKKEKKDKFRSRNFRLLLYPDDPTHAAALSILKSEYEIIFILHDKDLDNEDEEELKKPHYHVVMRVPNAIWNTALAKALNIKENYIRDCNDFNRALKYLIHFDNPEKYQYGFEETHGSQVLKDKLWAIILKADKSQEELSNEILDYIENYGGQLRYIDFMRWINANGLFSNLKSGSGWYRDIIKQHNDEEFKRKKSTYNQLREFRYGKELTEEERSELFNEVV